MSYKALELKDGRVALLHPDTPVVFATLEVAFAPNLESPRVVHVVKGGGRRRKVKRAKRAKKVVRTPAARVQRQAEKAEPAGRGKVDWAKGEALWKAGKLSVKGIAAALGCSEPTVYIRSKAHGWGPRGGAQGSED